MKRSIVWLAVFLLITFFYVTSAWADNYQLLLTCGSEGSGNGQFDRPFGVAVDSSGNVYVVDLGNNRIQKFDSNGTYLAQWGLLPPSFQWAPGGHGVAVDSSGNVYVVDSNENRIEKFSSNGTLLTQWGSAGNGDGQFWEPIGVAVDSSGNVYIADMGNYRIQKFNSSGNYLSQWGSHGSGDGQFSNPYAVAVDSAGNVYVSDTGYDNHRIQKFTSSGTYLIQWDILFSNAMGLAVDSSGNIYVGGNAGIIQKFNSNGNLLTQWSGQFGEPWGLAVDSTGNVYVSDTYNNHILKYGPTNTISLTASYGDHGSISPSGTITNVNDGATQTFHLYPDGNHKVVMSGTCGGNIDPDTATYTTNPITQDCTVIATFIPMPSGPSQDLQLPSGQNVQVLVPVTNPSGSLITITFDNITNTGTLSVVPATTCPATLSVNFLATCYNITFTGGTYTGDIYVTFPYGGLSLPVPVNQLQIYHGGNICTCTDPECAPNPNTANKTITGKVTSLSPFGIGYASAKSISDIPGRAYSTGANENMIALLAILAISAGVFILRRKRWHKKA
jgi:DNA-binding beta-propeller fold protein YncE